MATDLFSFRFVSPLDSTVAQELRVRTGMRISDIGNSWKDTPGSGQFAGTVHLTLERGAERDEWHLCAFTHDLAGADLSAVDRVREQVRALLTEQARDVAEVGCG